MQELSFKEILKTLLPKLKMLLIILLIGAVLGGCIGVARTYAMRYYGTTVEFYVNPKPDDDVKNNDSQFGVYGAYGWHVMDNMIKLLSSESFAEEMLLGDNGLPIESVLAKEADRTAIDEKIAEAMGPIGDAEAAKQAEIAAEEFLAEKKLAHANASSIAAKANSNYLSLVSAKADADEIAAAKKASDDAAAAEQQAKHELDAAEQDKQLKSYDYQAKHKQSLGKIEAVLAIWRETEVYEEYIELITKSVKYTFYNDTDIQVGNSTEALAKSFIYVRISVSQNQEIAQFVYDRVNEVLPRYVQANMAVPSGYVGTNCQRITRLDDIEQMDSGELLTAAIKYAVVLGALAFILGAIWIVVLNRSKKWYAANKSELAEAFSGGSTEALAESSAESSEESEKVDWQ